MKQLTAIALSGGIDSLVAAHLLIESGHSVVGIHFITGYDTGKNLSHISSRIGIDIKIVDCSAQFEKSVVDYFRKSYQAGLTPNPCLICNPTIKFGTLLSVARNLGASRLATGHYARIGDDQKGAPILLKGIDRAKDQSYFLARLTRDQLSYACFPVGAMTKTAVKHLAREKGLTPATSDESQDICFIKGNSYSSFLEKQDGFKSRPGPIEDVTGSTIGEHKGLHLYTIGQRRGIGCPAPEPYYVVRIDRKRNRLVVGFKEALQARGCTVEQINWIADEPHTEIKVGTRIRYRHAAAASTLYPVAPHSVRVVFETPQAAITPGQGAVFYRDDEVLGGGWIVDQQRTEEPAL